MLRRLLPWLAVVALVAAAVFTTDWGSGAPPTPRPGPVPSRTPAATPSSGATSLSSAEALSLVRNIRLRPGDLPAAFEPDRAGTRNQLDERASLDLCGASYPSEAFRLGARGTAFVAADGRGVRLRVIAYEHDRAAQALDELRATASQCSRPVPPARVQQPDTLALRVRSIGSLNRAAHHELVVERRGDVLVLLDTDRLTGARTLQLARLTGRRLESQLPAG